MCELVSSNRLPNLGAKENVQVRMQRINPPRAPSRGAAGAGGGAMEKNLRDRVNKAEAKALEGERGEC